LKWGNQRWLLLFLAAAVIAVIAMGVTASITDPVTNFLVGAAAFVILMPLAAYLIFRRWPRPAGDE
jgi:hypothetical protein